MRRMAAVLVIAVVAVWAVAMGDLRGASPAPVEEADDESAVEEAAQEPFAEPQVDPALRPDIHPPGAEPRPRPQGEAADDEAEGSTRELAVARQQEVLKRIKAAATEGVVEAMADEPEPDPTEHGEAYTSPDFRDAARRYSEEPRHVVWAPRMEREVRHLLEEAGHGERIEILSCRKTTCRLQLKVDDQLTLDDLLAVAGIQESTDLGTATPMSLRAGVLTVHFSDPQGGP